MKKISLTLTLLFVFAVYARSQWTTSSPNIYYNTGNVGIGTTTPIASLSFTDVNATNNANGITWYNAGNDPTMYGIHKTAGTWSAPNYQQLRLGWQTGILLDPGTLYGASYVNVVGGGLRVSAGNVGIGTLTPGASLVVNGKARLLTQLSLGADLDGPGYEQLSITNSGEETIGFHDPSQAVDKKAWEVLCQGGNFRILSENDAATAIQDALIISRNGYQISTTAFPFGNILIGKTTQANSGYILDVNGSERATKVVVNTTGADYVFDSSYHLSPLPLVKKYIQANHHLQGIAPAAEMQQQGLDLGANQTELLKKVEELTLYLIEQSRSLERQSAELKALRQEVNTLKNNNRQLKHRGK
jgi:hypothetical protein